MTLRQSRISLLGLTLGICLGAIDAGAQAPSKDQCLDAYERAQLSHKQGKLGAARDDYRICGHEKCPKLVQKDCTAAAQALEKDIPSIVPKARGAELSELSVTVDGQPLPQAAGDGSYELDPGAHVLELRSSDGRIVSKSFTLSAGQRSIEVIGELPAPAPTVTPVAPPPKKPKIKPAVLVLGGVAVVGLAGFVGFGLSGKSKESDLDSCKPNCTAGDVDSMRQSYLFADISLAIGLAAAGVAVYLHVSDNKPTQRSAFVAAQPRPRGGELRLGTSF